MRQVMTACFWVCLLCTVAGAALGVLMIWDVIEDKILSQKIWMTIAIVFLAAALTLAVGRTYLGKDPNG